MKAITKDYLTDIIFRVLNKSIHLHRRSKTSEPELLNLEVCTEGEMLEFIQTIPYFDERLKDFLVGNLEEETIIVSQTWETEFVKKTLAWAQSFEWLTGDNSYLGEAHIRKLRTRMEHLSLPY